MLNDLPTRPERIDRFDMKSSAASRALGDSPSPFRCPSSRPPQSWRREIRAILGWASVLGLGWATVSPAKAGSFFFSTGDPDGKMGTASRPGSPGNLEIESADDFILNDPTLINHASFTGLLPTGASLSDISQVVIELYRVFPKDSNFPADGKVPTRVNSPSDVAFTTRDSAASELTFNAGLLRASFTVNNSVVNGIHPIPNQATGGDGFATGEEVQIDVAFTTPLSLPADHYFFVPQVLLGSPGDFLWLSAPRPILPPGSPITPDLQEWIRNGDLDPDWLRVGTDIVGSSAPPTFNGTFTLSGTVPDASSSAGLLGLGLLGLLGFGWRCRVKP